MQAKPTVTIKRSKKVEGVEPSQTFACLVEFVLDLSCLSLLDSKHHSVFINSIRRIFLLLIHHQHQLYQSPGISSVISEMPQTLDSMEQQPTAIGDLGNELERFRKEWLEELATNKKEEGPKTVSEAGESTVGLDGEQKVGVITIHCR